MEDRISDLIEQLVGTWWEWVKANNKAMDSNLEIQTRKENVDLCEILIDTEYKLVNKINRYFDVG